MADEHSRIRFFPVSFFSMVMGLTGFAVAAQRAEAVFALPSGAGQGFAWFSAIVFLLLLAVYGIKLLRFPQEVLKELNHPVKLSFFPTISISLILLSIALRAESATLSFGLFALGAPMQLGFTLFVMSRWISHTHFEVHHSNPSWFIPVVGNILVPIAASSHGLSEMGWFFFSIGVVFWLVLLTIIINRVIFHNPLPEKLAPTFFILIAPPAVGFISYVKLSGGLDGFARVLFYTALFIVLLLAALHRKFRGIKFFLSWWAYSFPTAAFAIASMLMFEQTGMVFFGLLSRVMLVLLAGIIVLLLVRTVAAMLKREVCVEE
ncbi:MAG: SLAC1 anion channel family protein [Sulfurimicrobium sp.]|nr:SLAC1 anion channel family protein [Sulfurimicrobium sp.]MDP1896395.1 SLAC1 anion channel family protein [Sulfurimicrobium sp.]MDP2198048.1 SLAC1 anion channel family protein [Sulfurimicrobium sp.]MDP2961377.1 SLAC1 anion channel family protein [Sulfurimicrobium sp.]MDP3688855.1 SLAC1 anion channel family protein [Sulfurimicrobium sp.]